MKNIFENRVFMPGDLVQRTKGAGGSEQSRKNIWRILEFENSQKCSKGAGAHVELVEGCITNSRNGNMEGPGYRRYYWLRDLTHVEE